MRRTTAGPHNPPGRPHRQPGPPRPHTAPAEAAWAPEGIPGLQQQLRRHRPRHPVRRPPARFGPIDAVSVVTMQAVSGAGYPGVSSMDIIDNVVPYIAGEGGQAGDGSSEDPGQHQQGCHGLRGAEDAQGLPLPATGCPCWMATWPASRCASRASPCRVSRRSRIACGATRPKPSSWVAPRRRNPHQKSSTSRTGPSPGSIVTCPRVIPSVSEGSGRTRSGIFDIKFVALSHNSMFPHSPPPGARLCCHLRDQAAS